MTCTALLRTLIAAPDWLTTLGILFTASCLGAGVAITWLGWRYRAGIAHQLRQEQLDAAFKSLRGRI